MYRVTPAAARWVMHTAANQGDSWLKPQRAAHWKASGRLAVTRSPPS